MALHGDETEITDSRIMQRLVGMYDRGQNIKDLVRLRFLDLDDNHEPDEDDCEADGWGHDPKDFYGYPRLSEKGNKGLNGHRTRSLSSVYLPPLNYYSSACGCHHGPSLKVKTHESHAERMARSLEEAKKSREKADKKRTKKQKQKERRRRDKLEKEQQDSVKKEPGDSPQPKAEDARALSDESEDGSSAGAQQPASAKDSGNSSSSSSGGEDESSDGACERDDCGDAEELDLTSTFVSKAALIVKRKLEQKPKPERREKKKIPVKEEPKSLPGKPKIENAQDSAPASSPSFEDNIKISTDLAFVGHRFASAGEFQMAVKYFTDAIKYNPTEYKLFGNRSFCFEKMQEYEKALTDAELCLSMCPGWVKGLYRRGRALAGLKRYEEASRAFQEVLELNGSSAEAAQELMRVQILQLTEYGFTREQSSNALIIHGTVSKALEVLTTLKQPRENANGTASAEPGLPQSQIFAKIPVKSKPSGPVQNTSNPQIQPHPTAKTAGQDDRRKPELFPVWVGNLVNPVTESSVLELFSKVGPVHSVKLLSHSRCAFVNFTKQECCDDAIRRFHGFELMGNRIAVRYPDRIPQGMGISKSALRAEDSHNDNFQENAGGNSYRRVYRCGPERRGFHKS